MHPLSCFDYMYNIRFQIMYMQMFATYFQNMQVFEIEHKRSLLSNNRGPQSTHAYSLSNSFLFFLV